MSINYKDEEYPQLVAEMYNIFDKLSGVTVFPFSTMQFGKQTPYWTIDHREYHEADQKFPEIEWDKFVETEDNTTSSQELACHGGACEI